ncbi:MAG: chemotaxis protein CheA [Pseudobdellovibrionaceae bacterium]
MTDNKWESDQDSQENSFAIDFEQVAQVSRVFLEESKEILVDLDHLILNLEQNPSAPEELNKLFRKVHTIKGSVGAVPGGQLMGSLAHEFEASLLMLKRGQWRVSKDCIDLFLKSSRLLKVLAEALRETRELYPEELSEVIELIANYGAFKASNHPEDVTRTSQILSTSSSSASAEEEGVWISKKQFDQFIDLSGELLVAKNFFQMMQQTVSFRMHPDLFERRQNDFSQSLNKICDQFQNQIQFIRKEKISERFNELHVLVRQTSSELNKNVQLEIIGGDLLVDKGLAKDLYEALIHIIRNSIDHGIEDQLERAVQGKSPGGQLTIEVYERNDRIFVIYKDDGKGLDKQKILQKAVGSGLVSKESAFSMQDEEIYRFIFNAGFSTKEKITTMSGRGVGMDVVLKTAEKYNGVVGIENSPGLGLCLKFELAVPQHIMVESVLLCSCNDQNFAAPLSSVVHISSSDELKFTVVDKRRYCQYNGFTVPFFSYFELLNSETICSQEKLMASSAIFMKADGITFGLMVDKIEVKADLVVKSFGKIIGEQRGCRGISLLADENICYILDPGKIVALLFKEEIKSDREAA